MFSMPRPERQIAACSGEGPGACEGVGAGDNGYRLDPRLADDSCPSRRLKSNLCAEFLRRVHNRLEAQRD